MFKPKEKQAEIALKLVRKALKDAHMAFSKFDRRENITVQGDD